MNTLGKAPSSSEITPEPLYLRRREFLHTTFLFTATSVGTGGSLLWLMGGNRASEPESSPVSVSTPSLTTAGRSSYSTNEPSTSYRDITTYNNFYEFTLGKDVFKHVEAFTTEPWKIEITGLCENPMTVDARELLEEFGMEERIYRFRCVEAWAMVVPWSGYPFRKLIEKAKPKSEAKFIRMLTASKPEQMPGMRQAPHYPWPYFEGLRMDEAMNTLTFMATGIYGKALPKQHGAPLRLVVPWKYGYKSIKSIVKIEFIDRQPKTFWEALQPEEYPFESNVDPKVPHPRWSQATHRLIDTGSRERTLYLNGYADWVGDMYRRG
ncbi:MAG TPA: protein-methionine-sulfoxide reductase catalytic subunit MsrP [Verrucomicrobiales bacterium]|nr:protein-methionine-sulfoxide reductase catalytic subunit MsrP [Verrucomicrobiales bacterium]